MKAKIIVEKFDWTDKLAETAIEDFDAYQNDMSYGASTGIGLALAKLKMIEEGYLVVLPCKPGDTVYVVDEDTYGYKGIGVVKCIVDFVTINNDKVLYMTDHCGLKRKEEIYLTEQEAQKALERMKK